MTNNRNAATLNPFRYRGHYYDEDLNLYLVGTRLYDPETGRFVCADISALDITSVNGCNLFACYPQLTVMAVLWDVFLMIEARIGKQNYTKDIVRVY